MGEVSEGLPIKGRLKVDHYDGDGKLIKAGEWRDNVITTVGRTRLASILNSASAGNTFVTHMGFGTSTTTPVAGDTTLGTELTIGTAGYNRATGANLVLSNPGSTNIIQWVGTLTGLTGNPTIQEAGLFSASSAGTLVAHQLTGAVNLASSSESLVVTWQVAFP